MHRTLTIFAALLAWVPLHAKAELFERFFRAEPYECGFRVSVAEWRVAVDTEQETEFQVFLRPADRDSDSFEGSRWTISSSAITQAIELKGDNGRPLYRVSGLLSSVPKVVVLDRKGEPRADCIPVLSEVPSASERYAAVLQLLGTAEPTPDDASRVKPAVTNLPPSTMLPSLEQVSTQTAIEEKHQSFWERYRATSLSRAEDPNDDKILSGIAALWIERSDYSDNRWHGRLLFDAQSLRAKALFDGGENPRQMRLDTASALCVRVDGFHIRWNWRPYLELATGLPLQHWNRELAQRLLDQARSCENGDTFIKTVSNNWPSIEARIAGFEWMIAERKRISETQITLQAVADAGWFQIDPDILSDMYQKGISRSEVRQFLAPQRNAAVPGLSTQLASEAASSNLSLDQYPGYCDERRRELEIGLFPNDLQTAVFASCEEKVASLMQEAGIAAVEQRKVAYLSTSGTRADFMGTNGYSFNGVIPRLRANSQTFRRAISAITTALADAEAETSELYQTALNATLEEIRASYVAAEPLTESEQEAHEKCADFADVQNERLRPVSELCDQVKRDMQIKREEKACDIVWEEIDAPDGIQRGYLIAPTLLSGIQRVNIRKLICERALTIEDHSGFFFFFSEFRLTRRMTIGGTDIEFSARLNEPEAGGSEWTLDNGKLSPGDFNSDRFKTSSDLMGCIYYAETCFRHHQN